MSDQTVEGVTKLSPGGCYYMQGCLSAQQRNCLEESWERAWHRSGVHPPPLLIIPKGGNFGKASPYRVVTKYASFEEEVVFATLEEMLAYLRTPRPDREEP